MIDRDIVITTKPTLYTLRDYVQKALPTVFDDSLSYYEEISKILKLINVIIETIDDIETDIETLTEKLQEVIDLLNDIIELDLDELIQDVAELKDAVETIQSTLTTIQGDITNIQGDITDIQGDITDIQGDITNIQGDITNITEGDTIITPPAVTETSYYNTYGDRIAINKGWGTDTNGDGVISKDELNFALYKKTLVEASPSDELSLTWSKIKVIPLAAWIGIKARPWQTIQTRTYAGTFQTAGQHSSGAYILQYTADPDYVSYLFIISDTVATDYSVGGAYQKGMVDFYSPQSGNTDVFNFNFLKNASLEDEETGLIYYGSRTNPGISGTAFRTDFVERDYITTNLTIPANTNIVIATAPASAPITEIIATMKPKTGLYVKNIHTPIIINHNTRLLSKNNGELLTNYYCMYGDNNLGLEIMSMFEGTSNEQDTASELLDADTIYY